MLDPETIVTPGFVDRVVVVGDRPWSRDGEFVGGVNPDLINAGKFAVSELPGASYFHHADSFGMMRGRHLDLCILGAFQVSQAGDFANSSTGAPDALPAVGGVISLAIGATGVHVMTGLPTKSGESKLVERCTHPLTGVGCVTRVHRSCRLRRDRAGFSPA